VSLIRTVLHPPSHYPPPAPHSLQSPTTLGIEILLLHHLAQYPLGSLPFLCSAVAEEVLSDCRRNCYRGVNLPPLILRLSFQGKTVVLFSSYRIWFLASFECSCFPCSVSPLFSRLARAWNQLVGGSEVILPRFCLVQPPPQPSLPLETYLLLPFPPVGVKY
jgi:hypothetical protein